jgi:DNA-binding GntR family transcriptional regulator
LPAVTLDLIKYQVEAQCDSDRGVIIEDFERAQPRPAGPRSLGETRAQHAGRPNLKATIAESIRRQIFTGELRPGSKVDQDQLAADAGVSRLPVREALIQLTEEGLIDTIPRRGAYVAQITPDDIKDRYLVYGTLSGMAAARAAGRMSSEEIAELYRLVDEIHRSTDPEIQQQLTQTFHRTINRVGATSWLRSTLRTFRRSLPKVLYMHETGQGDEAERQLKQILKALETGDAEQAQQLVARHFELGGMYAVSRLELEGFWSPGADETTESA